MQSVGEVQSTKMQHECIIDCLPALDGDVRHAEKMQRGFAEYVSVNLVEAAKYPFKFKNYSQWYKQGGRLGHDTQGDGPLLFRFWIIGIVTVEAR